jgi:hypothetical protein
MLNSMVFLGCSGSRDNIGLCGSQHLQKRIVECILGVRGRYLNRGWFYSVLGSGV